MGEKIVMRGIGFGKLNELLIQTAKKVWLEPDFARDSKLQRLIDPVRRWEWEIVYDPDSKLDVDAIELYVGHKDFGKQLLATAKELGLLYMDNCDRELSAAEAWYMLPYLAKILTRDSLPNDIKSLSIIKEAAEELSELLCCLERNGFVTIKRCYKNRGMYFIARERTKEVLWGFNAKYCLVKELIEYCGIIPKDSIHILLHSISELCEKKIIEMEGEKNEQRVDRQLHDLR